MAGEWKVPGEKQVRCLLFGIKNAYGMICARTWASAVTDRLRHGSRATVVKWWDMDNRECLHLSRLLYQYNEIF